MSYKRKQILEYIEGEDEEEYEEYEEEEEEEENEYIDLPTLKNRDINNDKKTTTTETGATKTTTTTTTTTTTSLPNKTQPTLPVSKNTITTPISKSNLKEKKNKNNKKLEEDIKHLTIHEERQKKREACNSFIRNPEPLLNLIKNIIFEYQIKTEISFTQLKEIWKQLGLETFKVFFEAQTIHHEVIHILYYGVLGYTLLDQPINGKSCIIFLLYILYNSQIVTPKQQIHLTINMWETLLGYFNEFKDQEIVEAYQAFRSLRTSGAFLFSATLHPVSTMNVFKTNSVLLKSSIIPPDLVGQDTTKSLKDLTELQRIHNAYNMAKMGENGVIPSSLNIINPNFSKETKDFTEQNTLIKFTKLWESKTPGMP
ncbi:hypothetical protein ACTA71_004187 [Dictyostelium dimigraforme]